MVFLSRSFGGKRPARLKRDCDEGGEQSEARGLPKEAEPVISNSESAEKMVVGRILKDVWQLPGGDVAAGQQPPILPSYQQLCSSSAETLLPLNSIEEFLTAPSSVAMGSRLDEDFYSASSSLDMDMGRPEIVIDSATSTTWEEEEEEGISEESLSTKGEELDVEEKFRLATPTYVGRRQLELEEGSVSLSLYSEGGLTGWGSEGRWGGQLANVDILGLVPITILHLPLI